MKFCNLKVLADENISPKVIEFLKEQKIDVLDIKEKGWYGKKDEELLEIANKEQRFVLTHDSDFGTLAVNEGKLHYGIIYLRLKNLSSSNTIKIYEHLLEMEPSIPPGTILVVEELRVRIRYPDENQKR